MVRLPVTVVAGRRLHCGWIRPNACGGSPNSVTVVAGRRLHCGGQNQHADRGGAGWSPSSQDGGFIAAGGITGRPPRSARHRRLRTAASLRPDGDGEGHRDVDRHRRLATAASLRQRGPVAVGPIDRLSPSSRHGGFIAAARSRGATRPAGCRHRRLAMAASLRQLGRCDGNRVLGVTVVSRRRLHCGVISTSAVGGCLVCHRRLATTASFRLPAVQRRGPGPGPVTVVSRRLHCGVKIGRAHLVPAAASPRRLATAASLRGVVRRRQERRGWSPSSQDGGSIAATRATPARSTAGSSPSSRDGGFIAASRAPGRAGRRTAVTVVSRRRLHCGFDTDQGGELTGMVTVVSGTTASLRLLSRARRSPRRAAAAPRHVGGHG
jgi:hypothetical protein